MIALAGLLDQQFATSADLAAATRAAVGKSLRRPAGLTQLAICGALACVPAKGRALPTALLWQTTSGPRAETQTLLAEMRGAGEPMPYDFLATQPAIAAATLQPVLPGLATATHWPLPATGTAAWGPLLALAVAGLTAGRYVQALCAQLDSREDTAGGFRGRWLRLVADPSDIAAATASATAATAAETLASVDVQCPLAVLRVVPASAGLAWSDAPDLPQRVGDWLAGADATPRYLTLPAGYRQAVEFARPPTSP